MTAATVGILRKERIIYQRGFGWKDHPGGDLTPIAPETLMRVASVSKPFMAVAIDQLFDAGLLEYGDKVFAHGQPPGVGILPHAPYNGTLGDTELKDITVYDLLQHLGGFDRTIAHPAWNLDPALTSVFGTGDPMFLTEAIADKLGVPSPATQDDIVRFMLAQQLDYSPGVDPACDGDYCYSNFGFLLLGLIIEELTGMDHVTYLHQDVLADWGGLPSELQHGRTFKVDQDPSEPFYFDPGTWTNVYDPGGPFVPWPYGVFSLEAMAGHGDLISNTAQVLHMLDRYQVFTNYGGSFQLIGTPLPGGLAQAGVSHNGSLPGTYSIAYQSGELAIAISANERDGNGGSVFCSAVHSAVLAWVASSNPWPSTYATDVWIDFSQGSGNGKFSLPENNVPHGLALAQTGGTVKLKPSTTDWTGTIDQSVVLRAPLGPVTIGQP